MILFATLVCLVLGVDDTTMSLIANVDPIPRSVPPRPRFGLIQLDNKLLSNDSYSKVFRGGVIQATSVRQDAVSRVTHHKIKVAPKSHHSDAPDPTLGSVTPDVLMCYMALGANGLSDRTCDLEGVGGAVPSQVLKCTQRISPFTISDIIMRSQTSPVDFSTLDTARQDLASMDTPTAVQVTLSPCNGSRSNLPDTSLDNDYVVFVLLNPEVESAAENFGLANGQAKGPMLNAGLVFVSVANLVNTPAVQSSIATSFQTTVANCGSSCTANQLVQWTPSGNAQVDWFVGTPNAIVRIIA